MYSVLIQNHKTYESFKKYHALFMRSLDENQLSVCNWIETGTTLDSALPGLSDLVSNEEEWRAIIVDIDHEYTGCKVFETSVENPYDYCIYKNTVCNPETNEVPIIRLTHILGGVPAQDISFHYERGHKSEKGVSYSRYIVEEERNKKSYSSFDYDFHRPCEIVLITFRDKREVERIVVKGDWKNRTVADFSRFWERNKYPKQCRFLFYDMDKQGAVKKDEDMFKFWVAIEMLATNEIPSSVLGAYSVYQINPEINRDKFEKTIQFHADCMDGVRHYAQKELEYERNMKLMEEKKDPRFDVQVGIAEVMHTEKKSVKPDFLMITNNVREDLVSWQKIANDAIEEVNTNIKEINEALDRTADNITPLCGYPETEVYEIDKYQKREIDYKNQGLMLRILNEQKDLPNLPKLINETFGNEGKDILQLLKGRITASESVFVVIILIVLIALSFVSGLLKTQISKICWIMIGICIIVEIVTILIFHLGEHGKLKRYISKFEAKITKIKTFIRDNEKQYAVFLSHVVSYLRGSSFINIISKKKFLVSNLQEQVHIHLRAMEEHVGLLKRWATAFHVNVNFKNDYFEEIELNPEVIPEHNVIYSLETDKFYQAECNRTGEFLNSRYGFVDRLEIVREELYEDDCSK